MGWALKQRLHIAVSTILPAYITATDGISCDYTEVMSDDDHRKPASLEYPEAETEVALVS